MSELRIMVTAAGTGIGWAIAKAFADKGGRVKICDVDEASLARARRERPEIGAARVDVADEASVGRWFDEALADLGGLDVLVNNAGIAGPVGPVEDLTLDGWRQCLSVGLDSQFLTARRAVPAMKAQKSGVIINISSVSGLYGCPFRTPYAAAKWAVIGFTKSLAAEVGRWNIRVNAICPGAVEGERMDRVIAAESKASGRSVEALRAEYTAGSSLNRFVKPQEIADMALFLASPAAAMVSGQALSVDGNIETFHAH